MSTRVKTTKNKSVLLRLLIVAFCAYMLVSLGGLVNELAESRKTLAAVETEIKNTEVRLEEKLNLLSNSTEQELIEKAARERLGYVYPNEQIFVDVSGN
ncbi:MAG: septum formation initiator family protein [Acutalibacteraceae bacterium]|nr:septum formation initiator family protein [Acutalibacteraceae bacterium]